MTDNLEELERRIREDASEPLPDELQSAVRFAFNAARDGGASMDGDAGWVIHSQGHAFDLIAATRTLIATAREVEGLRAEVARLRERWVMIDQLRGAEGCSVEIIHDNPDPGGSNCAINVSTDFGQNYVSFFGETVDDCLKQAVASLNERKPK